MNAKIAEAQKNQLGSISSIDSNLADFKHENLHHYVFGIALFGVKRFLPSFKALIAVGFQDIANSSPKNGNYFPHP